MPRTIFRHRRLVTFAIAFALAAAVSFAVFLTARRSAAIQLWFFDVGQGDSELIRSASMTMLIDGGPDDSVLEWLAAALPPGWKKINVILLTNPRADRFAGLAAVLKRYEVGEFWWTGVALPPGPGRAFIDEVKKRNIAIRLVRAGDRLDFGGGRAFEVLFPFEAMAGRLVEDAGLNDVSVVGRFDCGTERALIMGDAGFPTERLLIDRRIPLESALLTVGHHGSVRSTSEAFLKSARPREAVISDGAGNRYGDPAPRVLAALIKRSVRVHRTDRQGTVLFFCKDGRIRNAGVLQTFLLAHILPAY